MSAEWVQGIAGGALLIAIGVIGFLVIRAINAVDTAIAQMMVKMDALAAKDTQVEVRIAEISVRLVRVEMDLASFAMSRERKP